jgi:hypothetical protein
MPMTESEANEVFDRLRTMLLEAGLDWMVDQVSEQIRFGKLTIKTVRVPRESDSFIEGEEPTYGIRRRASTARFPATAEYSPKERLRLLIEGIEQAVLRLADIETAVLDRFHDVSFASDETQKRLQVKPASATRAESLKTLSALIADLSHEV